MIAIVAVDKNWGIGYKGQLLVRIPEDLKDNFKAKTLGNTVVYGRKTILTFPGERLLPNRKNIIMSRNPDYQKEGACILHSMEDVLTYKKDHEHEKIFVCGGEEIYRLMLPFCREAIVTRIWKSFTADVHFPDLEKNSDWQITDQTPVINSKVGLSFSVCLYTRLANTISLC